jgi:transposase
MEMWNEVRHRVLVEGASKRSMRREYRIGSETLAKILANPEPPGYRLSAPRPRPKVGEFLAVIDEILVADRTAPAKQRHTSKRIFERLRDEHGYTGGITQVKDAVAVTRLRHREVFVPLSHPPGEAQFDFGEATVVIAGVECKAALAVMTLPYSDAFCVSAFPRECTETFQAGHTRAFEFFGGVPTRISYDNTTIAVKKVIGPGERDLTREFLRLESHHLFDHHFCRVGRGNEKGVVENLVGYGRRNYLVPFDRPFGSFTELNEHLIASCTADLHRRVRGKADNKADRLATDRTAMLGLPAEEFEPRRVVAASANSLSLVRFDRNDYSVPTGFAFHDVTAVGGIDEVTIAVGTDVVARHARHWGKEHTVFDPRHYLALLERKPGAFDHARPLEGWNLPDCFGVLRRRLEGEHASSGTREYIKVLRLLERATLAELTAAVTRALAIGATGADAIGLILAHSAEKPVPLFSLDGRPHLKAFVIDPPDLGAYGALTQTGT